MQASDIRQGGVACILESLGDLMVAEAEETQLARARARVVYGPVDTRSAVPQLTRD